MGGSFILFVGSLCGVLALFVLKYLEEERGTRTPLASLRRSCDSLVADGWVSLCWRVRAAVREFSSAGAAFCKDVVHGAATRLHVALHAVSVRFGEYLKRRGSGAGKGTTSAYVKNMLKYKEEISQDSSGHSAGKNSD